MQSEGAVLSRPSLWCEASRIINEEGYRAFWKGNLVTVAHRIPYTAVNFYAYEEYNKVSCVLVFSNLCFCDRLSHMICHLASQILLYFAVFQFKSSRTEFYRKYEWQPDCALC